MSNIATLGLEFTTQGAENKIEKLCKAFDELSKKSDNIQAISKVLSVFKPLNNTFITQLASLSKSFTNLKGINPEITESVKTFFSSFENIKGVEPTAIDSIAKLGAATSEFKAIKPETVASVEQLFSSIGNNLPNVDAPKTEAIAKLGAATSQFKAVNKGVVESVDKLFSSIGTKLPNIDADKTNSIAKLGIATSQFKAINKNVSESIEKLFISIGAGLPQVDMQKSQAIARLASGVARFNDIKPSTPKKVEDLIEALKKLKPLSADVRAGIHALANMFNAMAAAGKNASTATKTLGNSMGYAQTQTDGLSIAFRTLQGAVSFNFFKNAAAQAVEFGTELAHIESIAPELNTDKIGTGVMNMSSVLGNASESLKGLYYAYSSGIRGGEEDFLKFTETMRKTAITTRASFVPTIDAATAAMNAYNISVDRAGEISDLFYSIVKYGKASGEQLASSFGQVSPTAKTLGVSLDELGASIASLTKVQPTRVAITGLNNMLSKIMKPTKESRLALQKLGVDMSYAAVQSKGFTTVLEEVRTALNGNAEALKNIFPDIRGQRAAMHLLGAGWKDFTDQLKNFENKKGVMDDAFKTMSEKAAVQLGALPETMKKIVTEAGNMIIKFVTLGGVLTPVIAAFNNMSEGTREFFAAITLVVGGYAAYKAAMFALQSLQAIQLKNEAAIAAAQTAKLAQLQEEIALRTHLLSLKGTDLYQKGMGVSQIAGSRVGFAKGFGAAFRSGKWSRDWSLFAKNFTVWGKGISPVTKRLLHLRVITGALTKGLTGLGAILGKILNVVGAIFSPLGLVITGITAGIAGIIDIGQAMIKSGSFTNYGDKLIATDAVFAIYDWVTGTTKQIKEVDDYIERTKQNIKNRKSFQKTFDIITKDINFIANDLLGIANAVQMKEVENELKKTLPELKNEYQTYKNFKDIHASTSKKEYQIVKEINALELERDSLDKQVSNLSGNARKNAFDRIRQLGEQIAIAKENQKKIVQENTKAQADLNNQEQKFSELWGKSKEQIKAAVELIRGQLGNLAEIKSIFDAQTYKEASPDKQISISQKQFAEQIKAFKDNINEENADVAKKTLQAAQKNYNVIRDNAIKIGEDMAKLQMEGMLIGASDSKKYSIYSTESAKSLQDVKSAIAEGQYNAAAKSLKSYISNTQKAVAIQQKLANAEKQANDKTLQMIIALDKFKVTAMDFIDVNSTEAMKLQSRSFGSLPQFAPLTTQQTSAQAANDTLAKSIADYSKQIADLVNSQKAAAETTWQTLQADDANKIASLEAELNKLQQETGAALKDAINMSNELLAKNTDYAKNTAQQLYLIQNKLPAFKGVKVNG